MVDATPGNPFALLVAPQTRLTRAAAYAARPFVSPLADALFGLPTFRDLYARARALRSGTFEARALHALNIRVDVRFAPGAAVPRTGPLIVAANHPTGLLDGLAAIETVRQVRTDVRMLTNRLVARIPELASSCFFVDPFGGHRAAERSRAGLRAARRWLDDGGALIVFPSGEVAWRESSGASIPADSAWVPTVGRLALASGATVTPLLIEARNSPLFYLAGRVHPLLRTALLPRELLRHRDTSVRIHIGAAVPAESLRGARPGAATRIVRSAVEALASQPAPAGHADIMPAIAPELLERDILQMESDALLLRSGAYDVFCASADALPHVLREIGRLREITFRAVGEGTGTSIDLDRFDEHYEHLFVWHRTRREIVGAYRIGRSDRILATHGIQGFYTTTLFRYDERVLGRLGPALELGRSFVRAEYQRSSNALLLLWKGIGRFVARAPQYRVLYGPVSISRRYTDTSQDLLRAFLAQNHRHDELAELVSAINPPSALKPPARGAADITDVEELDKAIARLEGTQGIPVLLRQYLRLNASLLGFNVDPAFGDALDALMMVDLLRLPVAMLHRYLGADDAARFTLYHAKTRAA